MLQALKVQNYALIKNLNIRFGENFNAITGETGTGKSILLGALGLILGKRADTGVLLDQDRKCVVEGSFNLKNYDLREFFISNDLDYFDETIFRREISPSGRSRAFINDTPVNLPLLKDLGEKLVDIHSQHQTLQINDPAFQLGLLDNYAGSKKILSDFRTRFLNYKKKEKELDQLKEQEFQAKKDLDYFSFQLEELEKAQLQPNEDKEVENELRLLSNAEQIKENISRGNYLLFEGDQSIYTQISELKNLFSTIRNSSEVIAELFNRLKSIEVEIKDIHTESDNFLSEVSVDNERLVDLESRFRQINNLLQKHQKQDVNELLEFEEELKNKLGSINTIGDTILRLEKELKGEYSGLITLGKEISAKRKAIIPGVEKELTGLLKQMGIPDARISVQLEYSEENMSEKGLDEVTIIFSANAGVPLKPISESASGGELSRIMLSFKYLLADRIFLPTIVFDEIDMGISGDVAMKVGNIVKKLSGNHQVILISHLPQVASRADHHYLVYKEKREGKTFSDIRILKPEERVGEIAKMLSGKEPSEVSLQNARELLSQ